MLVEVAFHDDHLAGRQQTQAWLLKDACTAAAAHELACLLGPFPDPGSWALPGLDWRLGSSHGAAAATWRPSTAAGMAFAWCTVCAAT